MTTGAKHITDLPLITTLGANDVFLVVNSYANVSSQVKASSIAAFAVNASFNAVNSDIIPAANSTYSLGNSTFQWKSLYVSNSTIYIANTPISIDSTGTLTVNNQTNYVYQLYNNGHYLTLNSDGVVAIGASYIQPVSDNLNIGVGGSVTLLTNAISNIGMHTWSFGADGNLTLPTGYVIGANNPINGISLTTDRGTLLLGGIPEQFPTENTHFHIMKDTDNSSDVNLFFGDDFNYVQLPNTQGVIIGTSASWDHPQQWKFDTSGNLTLPGGLVINSNTAHDIETFAANATNISTGTLATQRLPSVAAFTSVTVTNNIYDDLYRPLLNVNALDINADGGSTTTVYALRDLYFEGGSSSTLFGKYEPALDGGASFNNRHAASLIDGGSSMAL